MKKFVCVHGHFYQPPRENPWTGEIDPEDSAAPFHDWNERIAEECYAANAAAPILDPKGDILARINNYTKISFDFGPTLLSWLRRRRPEAYRRIVDADHQSVREHGGHGHAIAQAYNHSILPLLSRRDKLTQVLWGVRDFEFHFGRKPEGMWLPECAVDGESLDVLADAGIRYTILAPHQAWRVRRIGFGRHWETLRHESIDTRHPYRMILENGRQFHVFFYHGAISRAIAFEGLLYSGDNLIQRLLGSFGRRSSDPEQLVATATDGESFGHHHKKGEMAIAYGLRLLEAQGQAKLTNFGEFLERNGSSWEVGIHDKSSWSCAHGIQRWHADCGCRINQEPGWNQKWRTPLREAFNSLQRSVDAVFEKKAGAFLRDPWAARNDYISVMLDPGEASRRAFLGRHAKKAVTGDDEKCVWHLLEAQKYSQYMFTSCGWFFDDISGIEPVKVMMYALRAIELAQPYVMEPLEQNVLKILSEARSNLKVMGTGADVWQRFARPARIGPSGDSHGF